jgi:hypothetical protein
VQHQRLFQLIESRHDRGVAFAGAFNPIHHGCGFLVILLQHVDDIHRRISSFKLVIKITGMCRRVLMCNRRARHTTSCGRRKRTNPVHAARADAASQDSKLKLHNPA